MAECAFGGLAGELSEPSSTLTIGGGLFGCTAFGSSESEAAVEFGECQYAFHAGTGSKDEYSGSFDISCPGEGSIVFAGNGCEVQIDPQSGLGPVTYSNTTGEPSAIEASIEMEAESGFSYDVTAAGGGCPLESGEHSDGVLLGTLKLVAGDPETLEPIGFDIE